MPRKTFIAPRRRFVAVIVVMAVGVALAGPAGAKDYGNEMTRRKQGTSTQERRTPASEAYRIEQEQNKGKGLPRDVEFDPTLRIFLSSTKTVFKPGEKPTIDVFLKNESNQTKFFKRMWSPAGAEGIYFRTFLDGKETWGSKLFYRSPAEPESSDIADAFPLDPGESKKVMSLIFNEIFPGDHLLNVEYIASFKVSEPHPRAWWKGVAKSNMVTMKATRLMPGKELSDSMSQVVEKIHKDILALKKTQKELSGYSDSALSASAESYRGTKTIEFEIHEPERREVRIYFHDPQFEPGAMTLYEEAFPYLGIKLFAHVDAGKNNALRNAILRIIKKDIPPLYAKTKQYAGNIKVEIEPFGPDTSKKLRRAAYIVRGTVKSKGVEKTQPYEYEIRKWAIDIAVKKVYSGKVPEKKLQAKSGAITTFFGSENPVGKEYIFLFGDKNNWQKEYTLIGVEPVSDSILSWLSAKYNSKSKIK